MNRIKSFTINHNLLMPGFYISREDGDVITYDLRTRKPNAGDYMDNATMHSLEHMFATYIRNSEMGNEVVYFGPMGCQTGFYLLVRNSRSPKEVFAMTKEVLRQIYDHKERYSVSLQLSADIMKFISRSGKGRSGNLSCCAGRTDKYGFYISRIKQIAGGKDT
jgi:S-ribosylhomocysteine lyase